MKYFLIGALLLANNAFAGLVYNPFTGNMDFTGSAGAASVSNSDGTLTFSPTTGAVVGSIALGHKNTWTAPILNSYSGTASNPALLLSGAPFAAGTATTNKPALLLEDSLNSTAWSTSGTYLGINVAGTFGGNAIDIQYDGSPVTTFDAFGDATLAGSLQSSGVIASGVVEGAYFKADSGSTSPASFFFSGYPGLGLYRSNANEMSITANSTQVAKFSTGGMTLTAGSLTISAGGITSAGGVTVQGGGLGVSGGLTLSTGDINTGSGNLLASSGSFQTTTGVMQSGNGSAASPSIGFASQNNLGLYKSATNEFSMSAGGSQIAKVNSSGITLLTGNFVGNASTATDTASKTGTGSTYVTNTSATLVTPALGTPSALVGTNISGTAANLTAGHVTTNANLTGPITSSGNATSVAAQTGTGTTFVMNTSPALVTPDLGTPSAAVLTNATGTAASLTAGNATNVATTSVSTAATFYPLFVASSSNGNQASDLGTGLTFNPSTNVLTTTTFAGALTGHGSLDCALTGCTFSGLDTFQGGITSAASGAGAHTEAFGAGAGNATSQADNTWLGYHAGNILNGGGTNQNTGIGSQALAFSTASAVDDVAIGYKAMYNASAGAFNSCAGSQCGFNLNTNDTYFAGLGYKAGNKIGGGAGAIGNSALGAFTLAGATTMTTGSYNIALGYSAGFDTGATTGHTLWIGNTSNGVFGINTVIMESDTSTGALWTQPLRFGAQFRSATTVATIANNACGSTSQGTISGTDQSGSFTVGTVAVGTCTISFSATLASAPGACILENANSVAAGLGAGNGYVSSITTGGFVVTGTAMDGAKYWYHCY